MNGRLASFIRGGLLTLVAVMPFHAFASVWLGSIFGHQNLIQSWKDILAAVIGIAVVKLLITDSAARARLRQFPVAGFIAFSLIAVIVTLIARPEATPVWYGAKIDLEFIVVFIAALSVATPAWTKLLVRVLLGASAVVILFGLLQIFVLPADFLKNFGYGNATVTPFQYLDATTHRVRILSTLSGPNQLGAFLILPLAFSLSLALRRRSLLAGLSVIAELIVLFASYSRAAWIGAAITLAIVVWQELPGLRRVIITSLAATVIAGGLVGPSLVSHNATLKAIVIHSTGSATQVGSDEGHASSIKAGLTNIEHSPLGHGIGTAGPASYHGQNPLITENFYLQLAVETGIIGLLFYLFALITTVRSLQYRGGDGATMAAAIIGLIAVSLSLHAWADATLALTTWTLAGALIGGFVMRSKTVDLAGVTVDNLDRPAATARITELVKTKLFHQITTINTEFIMNAQNDSELKRVLNGADLRLPDGIGLVFASNLYGQPLTSRVTGVEMCYELAELAAAQGLSLFLLGGWGGAGEAAARQLQSQYPKLKIAGAYEGAKDGAAAPEIIHRIKASGADILLVAFGGGAPQECWIAAYGPQTGVTVAIGVGGSFNFIAGRIKRAPHFVQALGFEWLWRLVRQPGRWKRQLTIPRFIWKVVIGHR